MTSSSIFLIVLLFSFLWTVYIDRKPLKKADRTGRFIYYGMSALVIGLFISTRFQVEVPTPIQFLHDFVAEPVYKVMRSYR